MSKLVEKNQREILSIALLLIFLSSLFIIPWSNGVINSGGLDMAQRMLRSMIHLDLRLETLMLAIEALWTTFSYALIAVSIAIIFAMLMAVLAAGVLIKNSTIRLIARMIIGFLRAIHELVWAWMFVAAIGLNPLAGIFALSIPYIGYLGKIYADHLEEVPQEPLNALQEAGANRFQLFIYGYLPNAFPNMLSYTMYRLECAIRSSSVLSFVGLGGIGFRIQMALQDMRFEEVWTYLIFLILLIFVIDQWSARIRRILS
ncbi:ABC transporter permease [Facklamia sp. 7083-14-GEN3]|uniref:PhnE/PtxC family ABC transporter permease n=1 Tax=Facklamia sp. 7083-14-GEN3 TaxID=2973478 RepID=UPI00215CB677|nr:ABC transporter permease [Facklamia sp. 7083-14-GEN3]MCR8969912.1 ABC transporter permease [Facklamia sp. 7083-14-GEN3]